MEITIVKGEQEVNCIESYVKHLLPITGQYVITSKIDDKKLEIYQTDTKEKVLKFLEVFDCYDVRIVCGEVSILKFEVK